MNGRIVLVAMFLIALGLLASLLIRATSSEELPSNDPAHCLEPFNVKDCTGPAAGKTLCYYCRYGQRPVICVFAREMDEQAVQLIARIDTIIGERRDERWAAFVVLLGEDTKATERQLQQCAAKHKILHTPLTIYRDTPEKLTGTLAIPEDTRLLIRHWQKGELVSQREVSGPVDDAELNDLLGNSDAAESE